MLHRKICVCFIAILFFSLTASNSFSQLVGGRESGMTSPKEVKASEITTGAISGDVNLFTGTYGTNYHLGTVATPSGLSFSVDLSYNASFSAGDNPPVAAGIPYGEGWNVSIPTITISVEPFNKYNYDDHESIDYQTGDCYFIANSCTTTACCNSTPGASPDVALFSQSDETKEGKLYWYAPKISIPGVISERFVFKYYDETKSEAVFVPSKFEKYVEARLKGNLIWNVILDDGTVYVFSVPQISFRSPSNQPVENIDPDPNLIIPKSEITTWYCSAIYNPNHPKGQYISFKYKKFGLFKYFNELDNQTYLTEQLATLMLDCDLLTYQNANTYLEEIPDGDDYIPFYQHFIAYKDILLEKVTANVEVNVPYDEVQLNYSTVVDASGGPYNPQTNNRTADGSKLIDPDDTQNLLIINSPGVSRLDSLYNKAVVYDSDVDEGIWTRFYHTQAERARLLNTGVKYNFTSFPGSNPYITDGHNDGVDILIGEQVDDPDIPTTIPDKSFAYGYLQSPRVGAGWPQGDMYEVKTTIQDNYSTSFGRFALFDINICSGFLNFNDDNLLSHSFFERDVDFKWPAYGYNIATGERVFSTFNQAIKWSIQGDEGNVIETSNFFMMPNLPDEFQGMHVQVGPANSDHDLTFDLRQFVGCSMGTYEFACTSNNPCPTDIGSNYEVYPQEDTKWFHFTDWYSKQPCDKISGHFGVGLPWYMMNKYMTSTDGTYNSGVTPAFKYWWDGNNGVLAPSITEGYACNLNCPTYADEDVLLDRTQVIRYSKNPYMLTSVEHRKTNGKVFGPIGSPGFHLVERFEIDYEVKVSYIKNNANENYEVPSPYLNCSIETNPSSSKVQNVFLIDQIRRMPADPTKENQPLSYDEDAVPTVKFDYIALPPGMTLQGPIYHGIESGREDEIAPRCTTYAMNEVINEIGGITTIEYQDHLVGIQKFNLDNLLFYKTGNLSNQQSTMLGDVYQMKMLPFVMDLRPVVKSKTYSSKANQLKKWDYEFDDFVIINKAKLFGNGTPTTPVWNTNHFNLSTLDFESGFNFAKIIEPELTVGNNDRPYAIHEHYADEYLFGKLKKTDTYDHSDVILSKNEIFYDYITAYQRDDDYNYLQVVMKPSAPYEDIVAVPTSGPDYINLDEINTGLGCNEMEFLETSELLLSMEFDPDYLNSFFIRKIKEESTTYEPVVDNPVPTDELVFDRQAATIGLNASEAFLSGDTLFVSDTSDIGENERGLMTNNMLAIKNVTEYKYYDATFLFDQEEQPGGTTIILTGTTTSDGYITLYGSNGVDMPMLFDPSWQVFEVKKYSPQLPGEETVVQYFYYHEFIHNLYVSQSTEWYDKFPEVKLLYNRKVKNISYEERTTSSVPIEGVENKISSDYYIYQAFWDIVENSENELISTELENFDSGITCPPDPPDPPDPDPELECIKCTNPADPPPTGYVLVLFGTQTWRYCPATSDPQDPVGRLRDGYYDDFEGLLDRLIVISPDSSYNALREIYWPCEQKVLLKKVYKQVNEVSNPDYTSLNNDFSGIASPLLRFASQEVTEGTNQVDRYMPVFPFEVLQTNEIKKRNIYGLYKETENERGLLTYYHFSNRTHIWYKDLDAPCMDQDGFDYPNIAVPLGITVGYTLPDELTTAYSYHPGYQLKTITGPNGDEKKYSFDYFGRLYKSFLNDKLLSINNYHTWGNDDNLSFEERAGENYVETILKNEESLDKGQVSRQWIDPLGKKYSSMSYVTDDITSIDLPVSAVYPGEEITDNWDRIIQSYMPFIYNDAGGIEKNPRFNIESGLNVDYAENTYEQNQRSRPLLSWPTGEAYGNGMHKTNSYGMVSGPKMSNELGLNSVFDAMLAPSTDQDAVLQKVIATDEDGKKTISYTNALGRKVATMQFVDENNPAVTLFVYDSRGQLIKTISPVYQETDYSYNMLGWLWKKVTVDQRIIDIPNSISEPVPSYYVYDKSGNVLIESDALTNRRYDYDEFGRKVLQQRNAGQDITGLTIFTENNSYNWLFEVYDNEEIFLWDYDGYFIPPNTGFMYEKKWFYNETSLDPMDNTYLPNVRQYLLYSRYNLKGKLSHTVTYNNDDIEPVPVLYNFYSYKNDGNMRWEMQQFNPNGISTNARGFCARIDYKTYNLRGSIITKNFDTGSDNVLDMQFYYKYDNWNRLKEVYANFEDTKDMGNKIADYAYDDATGLVTVTDYFNYGSWTDGGNNVDHTSYEYDIRNRLNTIESNLFEWNLLYDLSGSFNGNIGGTQAHYKFYQFPSTASTGNRVMNDPGIFKYNDYTYTYDGLNRLVDADARLEENSGLLPALAGQENYTYDRAGNIFTLQRMDIGGGLYDDFVYNYHTATNRLMQVANNSGATANRNYEYDYNGNLMTDDFRRLTETKHGRANLPFGLEVMKEDLSSVDITNYLYNNDDQRIFKTINNAPVDEYGEPIDVGTNTGMEFYLRDAAGTTHAIWSGVELGWTWYINGRELAAKYKPIVEQQYEVDINGIGDYGDVDLEDENNLKLINEIIYSSQRGDTLPDTLFMVVDTMDGSWFYIMGLHLQDTLAQDTAFMDSSEVRLVQFIENGSQMVQVVNEETNGRLMLITWDELRTSENLDIEENGGIGTADPYYYPYNYLGHTQFDDENLIFYNYDHLGNTRITYTPEYDANDGTIDYTLQNVMDYYPYGKILREYVNGEREKFLTTTNERDAETGIDYRWHRYSDSDIGRFLSVDPKDDLFTSWSPYNYVFNNPVKITDPNGDCPWCLVAIGVFIINTFGAEDAVAPSRNPKQDAQARQESKQRRDRAWGIGLAFITAGAVATDGNNHSPEKSKDQKTNEPYKPSNPENELKNDPVTGNPVVDEEAQGTYHTQTGQKTSDERGETYPARRTINEAGKVVEEIDYTDHDRPNDHPNPHKHVRDPETGKRGGPEPLKPNENPN